MTKPTATRARPGIAGHFARYASGNLLSLVAGFVSFPITTRLLSAEQFGVLGYWEVWVLLGVAIAKLGAGDAMMRFHPHGQDETVLRRYAASLVFAPFALSLGLWMLMMLGAGAGALAGWIDTPLIAALALATVLVSAWTSYVNWLLATRELSGLNTLSNVGSRWLTVAATLAVLWWWWRDAAGVYAARLAVGLIVLVFLLGWLRRNVSFDRRAFDPALLREGLSYGLPLALREIANIVLVLINRLMLKWFDAGYAAIGIYTIGFSLATYLEQLLSAALGQAINPVATRLYATQGAEAVKALKARVLPPIIYAACAVGAGLVLAGRDFVVLVASADKVDAAPVFIVAGLSFLLQAVISVAGMGLLLEKRSARLFALTAIAACVTIGANAWAIPRFGLMGAVFSTSGSQLLLQLSIWWSCSPALRCLPPWRPTLTALGLAGLCVAIGSLTQLFGVSGTVPRLAAAAALMVGGYVLPLLALDRTWMQWWRARRAVKDLR